MFEDELCDLLVLDKDGLRMVVNQAEAAVQPRHVLLPFLHVAQLLHHLLQSLFRPWPRLNLKK